MNSLDFRNFLAQIFGQNIINGFLEKKALKFRELVQIVNFMNNFNIYNNQGCQKCLNIYNKILPGGIQNFNIRNMDFPSWLGELNFDNVNRKDIMILGESVTNTFKQEKIRESSLELSKERKINMVFGLGSIIRELKHLPDINEKSKNGVILFWRKLKILLQDLTENWLNKLYISDIAYCNCNKIPYLYYPCGSTYLIKEIEYINPKIIFLLGHNSCNAFISIIQSSENYYIDPIYIKELNITYYLPNKLTSGYVRSKKVKELSIIFLSIPHTAQTSPKYQENAYWEKIADYLKKKLYSIF